jgi:hypothetical protein
MCPDYTLVCDLKTKMHDLNPDIPSVYSFSDQKAGLDLTMEKQKELIHGYCAATSYAGASGAMKNPPPKKN